MKSILIGCITLLSAMAYCQTKGLTIVDLKPKHDGNHFPELHSSFNPKVAEKINTFLQLDYLEHLPGVFKKHPFELVCYDRPNRAMGGVKGFETWKKEVTPKNILSLTLEVDFTGAYSEEYKEHHNFDLSTGNPIPIESIIHKNKISAFTALLEEKAKRRVNDFLDTLKMELPEIDSIQNREDYDVVIAQQEMYANCISDEFPYALEYYSFYFTKDSLHFIRERCSAHVNRAIDDLSEFDFRFSYAQMKPYFSDYGNSLIANNNPLENGLPEGKMYKGTIGPYPITILIQAISSDGSVEMLYWYDKKKIPIGWRGKYFDHHFSLIEEIETKESFETLANIEADWKNGKITGTWTNSKTHKKYQLVATPY